MAMGISWTIIASLPTRSQPLQLGYMTALLKARPMQRRPAGLRRRAGSLANPIWCWKREIRSSASFRVRYLLDVIFTPNVTARRWVRAIEIRPGQPRVVHHANLWWIARDRRTLHETAPGKGFPGMDLVIGRSPFDPDGNFLFGNPAASRISSRTALRGGSIPATNWCSICTFSLPAKREQVRPSIGLYFTDRPQTKYPLLVQLEDDNALDIPAGTHDFPVADDFRLPLDADVLAVYPHAHYLGKLLEAFATLPDGSRNG